MLRLLKKFHKQHPQIKLSKHYKFYNIQLRGLCVPKIKTSKPNSKNLNNIKSTYVHCKIYIQVS